MDERRRFLLLWRTLDAQRRGEIRRVTWFGRAASDPKTAWFVTMLTDGVTAGWRGVVLVAVGLLWVILGTVTIVLISAHGVDRPFAFGLAVAQIAAGVLELGLQAMYRRAYRLNEVVAVPPRG